MKNSEILSTYSNYVCFQLQNTRFAINASGNSVFFFLILLRVLLGNLALEPPPYVESHSKNSGTC